MMANDLATATIVFPMYSASIRLIWGTLLMLAVGGLPLSVLSQAAALSVSAVDVAVAKPEDLLANLAADKLRYDGTEPAELLLILEQLLERIESPVNSSSGQDNAVDPGNLMQHAASLEAYAECRELVLDMLYEWPSPALAEVISAELSSQDSRSLTAALHAAGAAADSPEVVSGLLSIGNDSKANTAHRVQAVLALAQASDRNSRAFLHKAEDSPMPALRNAAHSAADGYLSVGKTAMVGPSILTDYRRLPTIEINADIAQIVILNNITDGELSQEHLAAAERTLQNSGTVVIIKSKRSAMEWPTRLETWCRSVGVELPGNVIDYRSKGRVAYEDYRSLADFPFPLRDQPGHAAERAWTSWNADTQAAPIRTLDNTAALVVVQNDAVAAGGRVLFTTVDLASRPIYRENILRWVYGDGLLKHSGWDSEYEYTEGGYTPHIPWAKPVTGDKPKILYLTSPRWRRSLTELQQRLNSQITYVPYMASPARPARGPDDRPPSRMSQLAVEQLRRALAYAEIDALIFDNGTENLVRSLTREVLGPVSFETIPSDLRRLIYRRVHTDGLSLIATSDPRAGGAELADFVTRLHNGQTVDQPFDTSLIQPLPPQDATEQLATIRQKGAGQLAWFAHSFPHIRKEPSKPPQHSQFFVPGIFGPTHPIQAEEYKFACLAKTVLATQQEPERPRLKDVAHAEARAGMPLAVTVTLDREANGRVRLWTRDPYNQTTPVRAFPIQGMTTVVSIPPLPAGRHIVELQIIDKQNGVADFAAIPINVNGTLTIAEVSTGDSALFDPGDTIPLSVELNAPHSGTVRIEARDTYGRLTFHHVIRAEEPQTRFACSIPISHALSRLWDIFVKLEQDGHVLDQLRQPVGIALPPPERDFVVTADVPEPALAEFFRDQLGTDVTFGPQEWRLRGNFDFSSGIWSDPIGASPAPGAQFSASERQPCLSSVEFRLKAIRDAREKAHRFRLMGITDYMVDDESPLGPRCFAPASLAQFRHNLRTRYGAVEELNHEWNTEFQSWDEVEPLARPDLRHPGSYSEFIEFQHWAFAEYCSFLEMLMGDTIPGFKAGHSGGVRDNLMMQYAGALYYYDVVESAVSVKRQDAVIGSWYAPGYRFLEDHEATSRAWPWRHLLRGTTRIQLWYPTGGGAPCWHEDLSRPYMAFVWLNEEMKEIQQGIGKLLLHCERDDGPVAIYSSQRTEFALAALREIEEKRNTNRDHPVEPAERVPSAIPAKVTNSLQQSVIAQQVECRFVSEFQVEGGELDRRRTELLLLPRVISLSRREREGIQALLDRGGTVVAFTEAGTRNQHGTWLGDEFMNDLFGVKLGGAGTASEDTAHTLQLAWTEDVANKRFPRFSKLGPFQATSPDSALETSDGTLAATVDDMPAIVVKSHGNGRAVYVNFIFSQSTAANPAAPDALNAFVQDLLAMADIAPAVSVTGADGTHLPLQFGLFHDGDARYAGFLTEGDGGMLGNATSLIRRVQFPQAAHIYDARQGRYLGFQDSVETVITPSVAQLYAILPWKMTGISMQPVGQTATPGEVVKVAMRAEVEEGPPSLQAWHIKVMSPDGHQVEAHAQTKLVRGGQLSLELPLALNAPAGRWSILVRDAATGVTGQAAFNVTTTTGQMQESE